MTRRTRLQLTALLIFAGISGLWALRQLTGTRPQNGRGTVAPGPPPQGIADPELAPRLQALEIQRQRLDETVWAKELQAQAQESAIIRLWDDLRADPEAHALENLEFGALKLGALGKPVVADQDVTIRQSAAPVRVLSPADWRAWLGQLRRAGWRLEQADLRHGRFALGAGGGAESVVAVTLNAVNSQDKERACVRGDVHVQWAPGSEREARPLPAVIDASGLELVTRKGAPPFDHKVVADITPTTTDPRLQEPSLHLYDLNGDGLSEIILPRLNRVYWNRGGGEFAQGELCAHPMVTLNTWLIADFSGDGLADLLGAGADGLAWFLGDPGGRFAGAPQRIRFTGERLANPFVLTAGDVDGDGDLDLWLAQYKVPYQDGQMPTPYYDANDGWPGFLLVNDGQGSFVDRTEQAGLAAKRWRRTYSASFADLDDDADLDLVVVSDFAGADVYLNDGRGHFSEATARLLDEPRAFGMSHVLGDFNGDARLDFLMIGMNSHVASRLDALGLGRSDFPAHQQQRPKMAYGNRLYFGHAGRWRQTPLSDQVARTGWSWGVTAGDFDNDGDADLYIVNGHISGRSARDYESEFWRHDIYTGTSKDNPVLERHFHAVQRRFQGAGLSYGGFEKNRLFLNQAGQGFIEAGHLLGVSLEDDCRCAASDDLDGDGRLELITTTLKTWPRLEQTLHLFPNFTERPGNWIGVRLREAGPGRSPLGAKVIVTTRAGRQVRWLVAGDSYRSQHAAAAHFGLGQETRVERVEVIWPNGQREVLSAPPVNRWHALPAQRR